MGIIREPKGIDFVIKSEPWTEEELSDFRALIKKQKERNAKRVQRRNVKRLHVQTSKRLRSSV